MWNLSEPVGCSSYNILPPLPDGHGSVRPCVRALLSRDRHGAVACCCTRDSTTSSGRFLDLSLRLFSTPALGRNALLEKASPGVTTRRNAAATLLPDLPGIVHSRPR